MATPQVTATPADARDSRAQILPTPGAPAPSSSASPSWFQQLLAMIGGSGGPTGAVAQQPLTSHMNAGVAAGTAAANNVQAIPDGAGSAPNPFFHALAQMPGPDIIASLFGGNGGGSNAKVIPPITATPTDANDTRAKIIPGAAVSGAGGASPNAGPATSPTSDPNALAMQMFFQTTIAPMLAHIASGVTDSGKNAAGAMQAIQGQIPASLRPFFNPAQTQDHANQLAAALSGAALAAPQLDTLMGRISDASTTQRQAYYSALRDAAYQNAQATGAGGLAGLSALLGGANAAAQQPINADGSVGAQDASATPTTGAGTTALTQVKNGQ